MSPRSETAISPRAFLLYVAVWATYAFVRLEAALPAVQPSAYGTLALMQGVRALTGLLCAAPLALGLHHLAPIPLRRGPLWRVALLVMFAGAAWMVVDRLTLTLLASVTGLSWPWSSSPRGIDLEYVFVMAVWAAALVAYRSAMHGRTLQEGILREQLAAQEARHHALVAQLNPHFLLNTLNMLRARMQEDAVAASVLLTQLASLLRRVLGINPTSLVPLREELGFIRDYLALQQARFEDGLVIAIDVDEDVEDMRLPPLLLQPLVENCFVHGGPDDDGVRRLSLQARHAGDGVEITIRSSGPLREPVADSTTEGPGYGLRLSRERLELAFGDAWGIDLRSVGASTVVTVSLPGRTDAARHREVA